MVEALKRESFRSASERQVLFDAIFVGGINSGCAAEAAAALGAFGLRQMAFARAGAQHFAAGGNLEPLGHGFLRFNAFGTSHKINFFYSKRARNIRTCGLPRKRLFRDYFGYLVDGGVSRSG